MSKDKHKCVSTWDFSMLYTNIPHDKLKDKLSIFIQRMLKFLKARKLLNSYCSSKSDTAYVSKSMSKVNKNHIIFIKCLPKSTSIEEFQ